MPEYFSFKQGTTPLLLSMPHPSANIPADIAARMTETGRESPDRDRYVDRVYNFAPELGVSVLQAELSRYVVDLNRDPAGNPLYGDRQNSELCPLTSFDHEPLYKNGEEPSATESANRIKQYWRPYHDRLKSELGRLRDDHGIAILFEAHSIRSRVERFHPGTIPDMNIGTAYGNSADMALANIAEDYLEGRGYSVATNQAFAGGYITRTYGEPALNIHAIQLEMTWRNYMDEGSGEYSPELAEKLQADLKELFEKILDWAGSAT